MTRLSPDPENRNDGRAASAATGLHVEDETADEAEDNGNPNNVKGAVMSKPTCRWMQYALDALQIEEYIARYVLTFRRSWLRDCRAHDLLPLDTLLTAQVCRAAGIEADGDDLIRKVKLAFVDRITED